MFLMRALGVVFWCALFFSACKKPALQDTALIPDDRLGLKSADTFTVKAYSVHEDSIGMTLVTFCDLGYMEDPAFGTTEASFYLPFVLKKDSITFDDGPIALDSLVLYLRYAGTYGDWRYPQAVQVHEMTEGIVDSVDYFSNQTFDVDPVSVGEVNGFIPNMFDSVAVKGEKYPPLLRIKLDDSFGQKFIDAAGTSVYHTNEDFSNFFKGLYITANKSNGGKAIVLFDPYTYKGDTVSKLTVYYHDAQDTSKSMDFPPNRIEFVNRYVHDYSNSAVEPFINNPDTTGGDSLIFIQGLAGLNTKLTVPYLNSIGNVFINKAELVLTENSEHGNSVFDPPLKLSAFEASDDGGIGALIDEADAETDASGTRYKLNLSRYYQETVHNNRENAIFISTGNRWHIANRFAAGGGSHSKHALKLNLTYATIAE